MTSVAEQREQILHEFRARYSHLPPLPPLPSPSYTSANLPSTRAGAAAAAFFTSCAAGDLSTVRQSLPTHDLSISDLSFALEEASHNLRVDVVRYLLEEAEVPLHRRCFHRHAPPPHSSIQNIFTSNSPQLSDLLKVFLSSGSWHPNQLLNSSPTGPPNLPPWLLQDVALHHPRCLRDEAILKLLLDSGADPTIARFKRPMGMFEDEEGPTERLSGYILEMAVNWGSPASVDMLLRHGATLKDAAALHSLVRRFSPSRENANDLRQVDAMYGTSPTVSPISDDARLMMAKHLLDLGEDVNELKEVYHIVCRRSIMPLGYTYTTPPLSHAVGCMDWTFAQWLIQNGADPEWHPNEWVRIYMCTVYPRWPGFGRL